MLDGVDVLFHSSIRIEKEKIIYIDPYQIEEEMHDADFIFITHPHYDHFSIEDILKVKNKNTIIILPASSSIEDLPFLVGQILYVESNKKYDMETITFQTIPSYNVRKTFHPKENGWVGYIIKIDGISYYVAGDTDITDENKQVSCDVAFLPIGGTYTMNVEEAPN